MNPGPPVIVVGTQRSGTTWLGALFSRHPRLAYWSEPRHVWTWGNAYNADDVLTRADATPRIKAHIRRVFASFVRSSGRERLCEKTPSNCLRIPFVHEVYPEARILLVVRDGRSVIRSTGEIMERGVPGRRLLARARETPIWEWPAYGGQAASGAARRLLGRPLRFWGPRPPGWREWIDAFAPDVVRAKQWAATITRAVEDGRAIGPGSVFEFRYEDLMADPRPVMRRIVEFCGLDGDDLVEHAAATVDASRRDKWRASLDAETLELIRPHMEPTLLELGYSW